jgi:hydroxymethylbilane synthase
VNSETIIIATRGSALALVQSNLVLEQCRAAFPQLKFEIKIIKTTGDKLQTSALRAAGEESTKGLFTKELETALLEGEADLAVHSLKDLPTELPEGLTLGAVSKREDVRDVLIYRNAVPTTEPGSVVAMSAAPAKRGLRPHAKITDFPDRATIATSSTRRQAQLLAMRSDLQLVPIRGNVGTRLKKLDEQAQLDALVLAAAGLHRLKFSILPSGELRGEGAPAGLNAVYLSLDEMLPCVGQAALGIETRQNDSKTSAICEYLNDPETQQCVTAERAFLRAMGGGCLSPVAAYGERIGGQLKLRAVSFGDGTVRSGEGRKSPEQAEELGRQLAAQLK